MRQYLSQEAALHILLNAHRKLERRKNRYSKKISKSWKNNDLVMVIPAKYRPNMCSKTLLAALVKPSAGEEPSHCRAIDLLLSSEITAHIRIIDINQSDNVDCFRSDPRCL